MEGHGAQALANIRLIRQTIQPIKELSGFLKHHRIPQNSPEGLRFLHEIAAEEIERDLDQKFAALKNCFGLKRRELSVHLGEGGGLIETPFFRYRAKVDLYSGDSSKVIWTHLIEDISEITQITSPVFLDVFGKTFNVLELLSPSPFPLPEIVDRLEELDSVSPAVDYDKDLTWCEIRFASHQKPIRLAGNQLRISSPLAETTPSELLQSLAEIQRCVSEVLDGNSALLKLEF